MLLRRIVVIALLFSAFLAATYAAAGGFAFDVRISQERIHQTVAAKLPLQRTIGPVAWRIDAAELTVLDQGRIGVDATVHGAADGHEADAHIVGDGALAYRNGAFWLSDLKVDRLAVQKAEASEHRPGALSQALGEFVLRHPAVKGAIDEVRDEAIGAALQHADRVLDVLLAVVPVYELHDNLKENTARFVLVSVRTDGHDLVARLDPLGHALGFLAELVLFALLIYAFACGVASFVGAFAGLGRWLLFWW